MLDIQCLLFIKLYYKSNTILAPTLCTLYTGDLSGYIENLGLKIHSFADDTNIYIGFKPIDEFSETKTKLGELRKVVQMYMANNFLKLNVDKTQILVCGSSTNLELYNSRILEFNWLVGDNCCFSTDGKTLGVKLDNSLKFNTMINDTCRAGYFKLNKLKNMRMVLDEELKLSLVKCFILSKIDYCNILLNQTTNQQLKRLQKLVNASVRFIYNVRKATNITPYMKKAHFLPIVNRIKYKSCLYVYKILHGLAPDYLCEMISLKTSLREGLRSSMDETLVEPNGCGKTVAAEMCSTWNNLPITLRSAATLETFKRNLKTYYFRIAFDVVS